MNHISDLGYRALGGIRNYFYENPDIRAYAVALGVLGTLSILPAITLSECLRHFRRLPSESLRAVLLDAAPSGCAGVLTAYLAIVFSSKFLEFFDQEGIEIPRPFNRLSDASLEAELLDAVRSGYVSPVAALMRNNWQIPLALLERALEEAVGAGNLEAVKLLIGTGRVKKSSVLGRALSNAVEKGYTDIAARLIATNKVSPLSLGDALMKAAYDGNAEIVALLIATGKVGDEDLNSAFLDAAEQGHMNVAIMLDATNRISEDARNAALSLEAARNGDWSSFDDLLDRGELTQGSTICGLNIAAKSGQFDVLESLILRTSFHGKDRKNLIEIMNAAATSLNFDVVRWLLDYFSNDDIEYGTDYSTRGIDCLYVASKHNCFDVVAKLMALKHGSEDDSPYKITNDAIYHAMEAAYRGSRFETVDALADTLEYRSGCPEEMIRIGKKRGHLKRKNGKTDLNTGGAALLLWEQRQGKKVSAATMVKTLLGYNIRKLPT